MQLASAAFAVDSRFESLAAPSGSYCLRSTSRGDIISQDARLAEVLDTIDRVARSSCTVLVTGESGTGKELVVAALHDASPRRAAELVTINCGAIPNELVESELFGHAKGAFTGAQGARRGLVAAAEGGTLFLDEVGELPLAVQVKLLRLLQQREYTPLGETRAVKCDVRIVAATHRDLEAEVRAGRFREDLYYRLNVIHVELPALRERQGDLAVLARHFCRVLAERSGRDDILGLSHGAIEAIEGHAWPGNVRALENAIERGVLLARGPYVEADDIFGRTGRVSRPRVTFSASDIAAAETEVSASPSGGSVESELRALLAAATAPAMVEKPAPVVASEPSNVVAIDSAARRDDVGSVRRGSNPSFPRVLPEIGVELFNAVESYQKNLIRQALERTDGNKNRAAQLLGVNRTTLVEMIRRRGL
ncbi:MAG: sigma-54-dependent Fis family transcriptional regulator [Labilithrix sp.]|nr:sigma-54-dependent Fis family transcriptional regulator [Labilithrix sp.]